MREIDLIFRDNGYARKFQSYLSLKGTISNVINVNNIVISCNSIVILDAHFKGDMVSCEGIKLLNQIRRNNENFQPIFLFSWFTINQMIEISNIDKSVLYGFFKNPHGNCKYYLERFPIDNQSLKKIIHQISLP